MVNKSFSSKTIRYNGTWYVGRRPPKVDRDRGLRQVKVMAKGITVASLYRCADISNDRPEGEGVAIL